jgi:hypothetical protein
MELILLGIVALLVINFVALAVSPIIVVAASVPLRIDDGVAG